MYFFTARRQSFIRSTSISMFRIKIHAIPRNIVLQLQTRIREMRTIRMNFDTKVKHILVTSFWLPYAHLMTPVPSSVDSRGKRERISQYSYQ